MCSGGCHIDPKSYRCRTCNRTLNQIMNALHVPKADQEHTINWLIYRQYQ